MEFFRKRQSNLCPYFQNWRETLPVKNQCMAKYCYVLTGCIDSSWYWKVACCVLKLCWLEPSASPQWGLLNIVTVGEGRWRWGFCRDCWSLLFILIVQFPKESVHTYNQTERVSEWSLCPRQSVTRDIHRFRRAIDISTANPGRCLEKQTFG